MTTITSRASGDAENKKFTFPKKFFLESTGLNTWFLQQFCVICWPASNPIKIVKYLDRTDRREKIGITNTKYLERNLTLACCNSHKYKHKYKIRQLGKHHLEKQYNHNNKNTTNTYADTNTNTNMYTNAAYLEQKDWNLMSKSLLFLADCHASCSLPEFFSKHFTF